MNNKVLEQVIKVLQDKMAIDINVIDFERQNPFTEYFVVCEANSKRQIDAIVDGFVQLGKTDAFTVRHIDGKADSGRVAVDLYEVVIHIFDKETRKQYDLDKLFFKHPQKQYSLNV